MGKYWFFVLLVLAAPFYCLASDLSKGLLESPENWAERQSFLKNGAQLVINSKNLYPTSIFMEYSGRSLSVDLGTDKQSYKAGEQVDVSVRLANSGFPVKSDNPAKETLPYVNQDASSASKAYYLWAGGNLFVEVYRLSSQVKDGELLVAAGKAYDEDNLSLFQNEEKQLDFHWLVPLNANEGTYEIRVYPTSRGMLLRRAPDSYRAPFKIRITVENGRDEVAGAGWDLNGMKLEDENIKLKDKVLWLESQKTYNLAVPIKNNGAQRADILVTKKVLSFYPEFGKVIGEEKEEVSLEPNEEKPLNFKLSPETVKGEPEVVVFFGYTDLAGQQLSAKKEYATFPLGNFGGEEVLIPFGVKDNVGLDICGMGINTLENRTGIGNGSDIMFFLETHRLDATFYQSGESRRSKEDNIRLDLALFDAMGNKIDELGYDGPSWDRTGEIFKIIKLHKDYSYLKLVGTLSSNNKSQIDREEIEYNFAKVPVENRILARLKEWIGNNALYFSSGWFVVLVLVGAAAIIRSKRKNKSGR